MDIGIWLQVGAIIFLILWRFYWHFTEQKAEKEKPKKNKNYAFFHKNNAIKLITLATFIPVSLQLLGLTILPFAEKHLWLQVLGFFLVAAGWFISVRGRHDLGTNWARSYDYQVKDKQELVTTGIYKYIRHPIYSGIALMFLGSELIVQSYMVYIYLLIYIAAYIQASWEEKLLISHFGEKYSTYMKRSKRFIPFLW